MRLLDDEYNTAIEGGARGMSINARLFGLLDENSSDDFSYGERVIIDGSFPETITECMVSSNLAELNSLSVGDGITFRAGPAREQKVLTITGIFSDATIERRQANHRASQLNTRNDIITTYIFFDGYDDVMDSAASFLLKDSNDLAAFQMELYSESLPESYTVQYDTVRYTEAAAEINQIYI